MTTHCCCEEVEDACVADIPTREIDEGAKVNTWTGEWDRRFLEDEVGGATAKKEIVSDDATATGAIGQQDRFLQVTGDCLTNSACEMSGFCFKEAVTCPMVELLPCCTDVDVPNGACDAETALDAFCLVVLDPSEKLCGKNPMPNNCGNLTNPIDGGNDVLVRVDCATCQVSSTYVSAFSFLFF